MRVLSEKNNHEGEEMSILYLYTKKQEIHVRIDDIHVSWTAPDNLIRFVSTEQKPRCAFTAKYESCDKARIVEKTI